VLIFRENKDFNQSESWKESFKLLSIQDESTSVAVGLSSDTFFQPDPTRRTRIKTQS
jgi:hypothetical protein